MTKTENYRGFEISWEEPPHTSAGYALNIASESGDLTARLQMKTMSRGAHVLPAETDLSKALTHARHFIDGVLDR